MPVKAPYSAAAPRYSGWPTILGVTPRDCGAAQLGTEASWPGLDCGEPTAEEAAEAEERLERSSTGWAVGDERAYVDCW